MPIISAFGKLRQKVGMIVMVATILRSTRARVRETIVYTKQNTRNSKNETRAADPEKTVLAVSPR